MNPRLYVLYCTLSHKQPNEVTTMVLHCNRAKVYVLIIIIYKYLFII